MQSRMNSATKKLRKSVEQSCVTQMRASLVAPAKPIVHAPYHRIRGEGGYKPDRTITTTTNNVLAIGGVRL